MDEDSQEPVQEILLTAPLWAISAKIVEERPYGFAGQETKRGTDQFNANQKVYLCEVFWGMGGETSTVIGRYRGKYKFITLSLKTRYLTHFRAEMLYIPAVIRRIGDLYTITPELIERHWMPFDGSELSHEKALYEVKRMNETADYWRAERLKRIEEQRSQE